MSTTVTLHYWDCTGTSGQNSPLLSNYSQPTCSPANAGGWKTQVLTVEDAPPVGTHSFTNGDIVAVLMHAIMFAALVHGFHVGRTR